MYKLPGARQSQGESRAETQTGNVGRDGAAVYLDDCPHDRQAEPEAGARPVAAGVRPGEAIEDVRMDSAAIPPPLSWTTT